MLIKGRKSSRLAKSSDKSLNAIKKSHKEKERHECPLCSKVYLNTKCLETHFETMHPDPEPSQTKVKPRF